MAAAAERPKVAVEAPAGTLTGVAPLASDQWPAGAVIGARVTYTSTGVGGMPTTVTGRVFAPGLTPPAGGWPVLSYTHGTTGLGDSCAPSGNPPTLQERTVLGAYLRQGFAVVATDYAGLGGPGVHPYLDGPVAAYGAIDIVRAMHRLAPGLFAKWWAVAGLSQGGHAALFTGALATKYAPELDFRGTVSVAPPSNLTPIVSRLTPDTTILPNLTMLFSYILAGVQVAHPDLDLGSYLSPLGTSVVSDAQRLCNADQAARTKGMTVGQFLGRPLDDRFAQAMGSTFDVPTAGYDHPVFIAQSDADQVVPSFLTNQLVSALKASAQPVTYRTYTGLSHVDTETASLNEAISFLRSLTST
ncbi:lipase family protein [Amycolatopsis japonica]|uniref:lipase family protein n=1 Tax=Amycolatopsis japonica TaxID=208439 RepID=UPI0033EA8CF3